MNPQKKANDINKLLSDIAKKDREKLIKEEKECMMGCAKPNTHFRDELSRKEYSISGMCQNCQDSFFGVHEENEWEKALKNAETVKLDTLQFNVNVEGDSKPFPLFLYIYGHDGFHDRAIRINNSEELEKYFYNEVALAISEKREVRITDIDDMIVFHAAVGKIIFDGAKHYGEGKELKDFDN